ncbi:MAG: hypothetical protein LBU70_01805 [Chitinispirillales bacterium]|jgi:hypothetical protein|nr:hypothetical protein [Chitinispirillales bacterium]
MKRILTTIFITAMILVIAGCEEFSTSYQRIDADEFRLLDFIYEPADVAPGDTLTLTAVFAGKTLDLYEDLEWWISFNVIHDLFFSSETVVDSIRLNKVAQHVISPSPRWSSDKTQSITFEIVIPEDIMDSSTAIPTMWVDMLPPNMRNVIPTELASMTKHQIINVIKEFPNTAINDAEHAAVLRAMLQWFTVPIRISAKTHLPGRLPHTIRSTHFIRYNSRFPEWAPINNNPIINEVVMYKVKGEDVTNIDDKNGLVYEEIKLDRTEVKDIVIEKGYSYFLDAVSTNFDKTWTMDGNQITERHRIYRQFQLDANEMADVDHSRYMSIDNFNGKIMPPTDRRITKVTFWVTIYDEALNERMRPQGSALEEVSARFVYR